MSVPRRYWDSGVFLALLLPEPERFPECRSVLKAAEKGHVQIVTSALTLTELIHLKGKPKLHKDEHEAKIRGFFQHQYIIIREVDRFIAEQARDLIWRHGLHPKDAIHVATALRWRIPILDTFDDTDLLPLNRKLGNPPLEIGHPHAPEEPELPFPPTVGGRADEDEEEEEE
jgi:predicted nucleic acid-binding protein